MVRGMTRLAGAVAVLVLAGTAYGKKVICVDGCNSAFVNNHEGYERALGLAATDVIQVGGSLTDCLAMLVNGDTLVIIAHGTGTGTCFVWDGMEYTGFGAGAGQLPVPDGFAALRNITFRFCTCWSARDPDGGGADTSLVDKLTGAMGGAGRGHVPGGFNDLARARVCFLVRGGTAEQRAAAIACLEANGDWMNNPPANRPGTGGKGQPANQQTAAQMAVDNCEGAGGAGNIRVTIPNRVPAEGTPGGYKQPVNTVEPPAPGDGAVGCSCTQLPGCGWGEQESVFVGDIPTVPEWGLIAMTLLAAAGGTVVIVRRGRVGMA